MGNASKPYPPEALERAVRPEYTIEVSSAGGMTDVLASKDFSDAMDNEPKRNYPDYKSTT